VPATGRVHGDEVCAPSGQAPGHAGDLNSAHYQAFDAEIKLISPTPEEKVSMKVSMASNAAFARYGIDRPAYLDDFEFTVVPGPLRSINPSS
jgi:hypothetical protein